ncbi:hypothetical protein GRB29_05335 [Streptococcus pneumoniae]|nr:hypothetical protein [Streptococcus pneumoniae]
MFHWINRIFGNQKVNASKVKPSHSLKTTHSDLPDVDVALDCENCGSLLVIRIGRYGKFLGCSKYPTCTYTKSWDNYIWEKAIEDEKVLYRYLGIISGKKQCYRCQKWTTVSGVGLTSDNFKSLLYPEVDIVNPTGYDIYIVAWSSILEKLPSQLTEYIIQTYPVKTRKNSYYNICENCQALQGDYFVYSALCNPDNPFDYYSHHPLSFEVVNLGDKILPMDVELSEFISPNCQYWKRTTLKKSDVNIN